MKMRRYFRRRYVEWYNYSWNISLACSLTHIVSVMNPELNLDTTYCVLFSDEFVSHREVVANKLNSRIRVKKAVNPSQEYCMPHKMSQYSLV